MYFSARWLHFEIGAYERLCDKPSPPYRKNEVQSLHRFVTFMEYEYGSGPSPIWKWSKHWNSGIVPGYGDILPSPRWLHFCCMTFLHGMVTGDPWPLGEMIQVVSCKCILFVTLLELTYPIMGKGKLSSKVPWEKGICLFPGGYFHHRIISSNQLMSLPFFSLGVLPWGGFLDMRQVFLHGSGEDDDDDEEEEEEDQWQMLYHWVMKCLPRLI